MGLFLQLSLDFSRAIMDSFCGWNYFTYFGVTHKFEIKNKNGLKYVLKLAQSVAIRSRN